MAGTGSEIKLESVRLLSARDLGAGGVGNRSACSSLITIIAADLQLSNCCANWHRQPLLFSLV